MKKEIIAIVIAAVVLVALIAAFGLKSGETLSLIHILLVNINHDSL